MGAKCRVHRVVDPGGFCRARVDTVYIVDFDLLAGVYSL